MKIEFENSIRKPAISETEEFFLALFSQNSFFLKLIIWSELI